jgi:hypothetical protein
MCTTENITKLRDLSIALLSDGLKEIQTHQQKADSENEACIISGEYLLLEAKEYVEATWSMILSEKYNASLSLSRWILEASLNLFWAVAEKEEKDDKLKILAGEALKCEANLQEGLAVLWPEEATAYNNNAQHARQVRNSLRVKRLENLGKRMEDIKQENNPKWPDLYPLYKICCRSSHPGLKVWERFDHSDDETISREPVSFHDTAIWMAASSTFYLVTFTYCLVGLGDSEHLKAWWKNKVRPLLDLCKIR